VSFVDGGAPRVPDADVIEEDTIDHREGRVEFPECDCCIMIPIRDT
jgi:hypothetical protein